jgi:hypothetical protein
VKKKVVFRKYVPVYAFVDVEIADNATDDQLEEQAWIVCEEQDIFNEWPIALGPVVVVDGNSRLDEESWQCATPITTFDDDIGPQFLGHLDETQIAEYQESIEQIKTHLAVP